MHGRTPVFCSVCMGQRWHGYGAHEEGGCIHFGVKMCWSIMIVLLGYGGDWRDNKELTHWEDMCHERRHDNMWPKEVTPLLSCMTQSDSRLWLVLTPYPHDSSLWFMNSMTWYNSLWLNPLVYILWWMIGDSPKLIFLVNTGRLEAPDQIEQCASETLNGTLGLLQKATRTRLLLTT